MVSALGFRCCSVIPLVNQSLLLTAASKESDESRSTRVNFHPKVINQFYCKLPLSSDIVKAEAIVVEPFK